MCLACNVVVSLNACFAQQLTVVPGPGERSNAKRKRENPSVVEAHQTEHNGMAKRRFAVAGATAPLAVYI
uniref:Putative secreted protein n=1 Tax=Anopheles marajoara TaxID=58244 RepID=A0A2M4CEN3_9DIPT